MYAVEVYLAIHPFKNGGAIVIGERCKRDLYAGELGVVVIVSVQTRFQPVFCALLPVRTQQLVTVPVEEEYPYKQYGRKLFQQTQDSNFFYAGEFFCTSFVAGLT